MSDVLINLLISMVAERKLTVNLVGLGCADDTTSDDYGDVSDAANVRVELMPSPRP